MHVLVTNHNHASDYIPKKTKNENKTVNYSQRVYYNQMTSHWTPNVFGTTAKKNNIFFCYNFL